MTVFYRSADFPSSILGRQALSPSCGFEACWRNWNNTEDTSHDVNIRIEDHVLALDIIKTLQKRTLHFKYASWKFKHDVGGPNLLLKIAISLIVQYYLNVT